MISLETILTVESKHGGLFLIAENLINDVLSNETISEILKDFGCDCAGNLEEKLRDILLEVLSSIEEKSEG